MEINKINSELKEFINKKSFINQDKGFFEYV